MEKQYRKKPVIIQAVQWNGKNEHVIMDFVGKGRLKYTNAPPSGYEHNHDITNDMVTITIPTREGEQIADRYDYIIKGYSKEAGYHCWVCKPDYMKDAYEEIEDQKTDYLKLYEIDATRDKNQSARHY